MKVLACIALLLVAASATSLMDKYPINFTQKRSIMTLLTQVESQLKSGGPMDAITKVLNDFKVEINEEQVKHDQLWAGQQVECADENAFRETEVANAVAALKEASETLDGCQAQKVRAEGDLAITKKQLQEARNLLAVATDTRRREAYNFETAATSYEMTTRMVDEALVILEEMWNGESTFAQLNSHVNQMLKSSMKIRKAHLLSGVMATMAQLSSSNVDEAILNRIKDMFINHKEKLQEEFELAAKAEQAAIAAFKEEEARLETMIEQLTEQQAGLEAEIAALNKCVVTQQGIVMSATTKRDRNQRIWDDAMELCNSVEAEYHTSTEARNEELELLAAIQERVEARFAEVSAGVTKRGETDAEDFEYNNATEYDDSGFQPSQ